MLFPGQFPRQMHTSRRTSGRFSLSNRQFNQQPFNSVPFTSQPQHQFTSIASKGVGGLSKTLDNVQQVLRVIESATPIVQQYGPMVKNLPAMYRMMKAFKDINLDEDENEDNVTNKEDANVELDELDESSNEELTVHHFHQGGSDSHPGQSKPKLFI